MQHPGREKVFSRQSQAIKKPQKIVGIRPSIFYVLVSALMLTNMVTLVGFLMSGDIAKLMAGQSDQVHLAYQDRIAQLRLEVDRLNSRQYAQAGNFNLQLQELAQLQQVLGEQHEYVRTLASKAEELGLTVADASVTASSANDEIVTGSISVGSASAPDLDDVTQSLNQMMTENRLALSALSESATASADTIVDQLGKLGIDADIGSGAGAGVGGPFVPVDLGDDALSLTDEANAVAAAFDRFSAARAKISTVPITTPLHGKFRLSSNFGTRKDPFLKRNAFHSGVDFAAPSGTPILSAGAGVVVFAGQRSGYGNVVEVEHPGGLVSRYAHMSSYSVSKGDKVDVGSRLGSVGSTGRSTGPHLHFEVRKKDSPINPIGFLKVGTALAKFL